MSRPSAVFVLGAGRAGLAIARAIREAGLPLAGVHGRRARGGAHPVTAGPLPVGLRRAGVVLVAVRDPDLDAALAELAAGPLTPGAVVLHLSGSRDPAALATLREAGHPAGTFHPLLPLAGEESAPLLRGAWIGVDGDPDAVAAADALAEALGARVLHIPPGGKTRYHAAAVLASNFPVVLAALAERVLRDEGVEEEAARGAVRALLLAAAENVARLAPVEALTGPVVRGDVEAVAAHLRALAYDSGVLAAYRALTASAVDVARAGPGADPDRLAEIERALLEPAGDA